MRALLGKRGRGREWGRVLSFLSYGLPGGGTESLGVGYKIL